MANDKPMKDTAPNAMPAKSRGLPRRLQGESPTWTARTTPARTPRCTGREKLPAKTQGHERFLRASLASGPTRTPEAWSPSPEPVLRQVFYDPVRRSWQFDPPKPLTGPSPDIPLRVRTRQMVSDLAATARLVWEASAGLFSLILVFSVILGAGAGRHVVGRQAAARCGGARGARRISHSAGRVSPARDAAGPAGGHRRHRRAAADHLRRVARAARRHAAEPHQPPHSRERPPRSTSKASRTPRPTTRCATPTTKWARARSA